MGKDSPTHDDRRPCALAGQLARMSLVYALAWSAIYWLHRLHG